MPVHVNEELNLGVFLGWFDLVKGTFGSHGIESCNWSGQERCCILYSQASPGTVPARNEPKSNHNVAQKQCIAINILSTS
jgi:hypothetical protein